jgi:hypothetical protein
MSAAIYFFATGADERLLLEYLFADDAIHVLVQTGNSVVVTPAKEIRRSKLRTSKSICIHNKDTGRLVWHRRRPRLNKRTHASLVRTLFDRDQWDTSSVKPGDALLDFERSAVLTFVHGRSQNRHVLPSGLHAAPGSIRRLGAKYDRWISRCWTFVRKHSTLIHNWKSPSKLVPNTNLITVFAFPDALKKIRSGRHNYGIH